MMRAIKALLIITFIFISLCVVKHGKLKQDMIERKQSRKVTWFTALNYPSACLVDADVQLVKIKKSFFMYDGKMMRENE